MFAAAFDTLEFTEQLRAAGVPEEQAKGHVRAFSTAIKQMENNFDEQATKHEIKVENKFDRLATKHEIKHEIKGLEVKIAESKAEMIKWMFGVAAGQAAFIIAIFKLFPSH